MKQLNLFLIIFFSSFLVLAQSINPIKTGGSKFLITCANLSFEVDSAKGARISSFKIATTEILYVDFKTTDMAGSTFWQSPQIWPWPPAGNLESKPFKSKILNNKLSFRGAVDPASQLRFYKTMYANLADTSISIEYVIKNEKSVAQKWAPWEITRVKATGLTVFAKGSGSITGDMASRTSEVNGYEWYDQDFANSPGNKFFCDGKGWLAHVTSDNVLFIKKFTDISASKAAPAEAEVEVYTASDDSYTELEDQGAYGSIAAKDSVTWKVKWFARQLPVSVDANVGSKSLAAYIEKILASDITSGTVLLDRNFTSAKVYPNPASETITIESSIDQKHNYFIHILNLQGKVLISQAISSQKTTIDIQDLRPGNYIYEIRNGAVVNANGQFTVIR